MFVLLLTVLQAQEPLTGKQILERVSTAYRSLGQVRMQVEREDDIQVAPRGYVATTKYDFAAQGFDKYRIRVTQPDGSELWMVSDGGQTWKANSDEKAWTRLNMAMLSEGEATHGARDQGPQDFRSQVMGLLISRPFGFSKFAAGEIEVVKTEPYKGVKSKPDCYVLRFAVEGATAKQEVWIDREKFWVWQTIQQDKTKAQGKLVASKITLKMKSIETTKQPDNLFAFEPPKNWKEEDLLVLPGEERLKLTGQTAANFSLKTLSGESFSLADAKGKTVVVDFWATWCPPCREEMPHLEKLYNELTPQGVVFAGISNEETGTIKSFVKKNNYTMPVLLDPKREVQSRYGVHYFPTLLVIDGQGVIREHVTGSRSEAALRRLITGVTKSK
jgi:peroxiredoxin/outer membrane lipoprotein-sorting protein